MALPFTVLIYNPRWIDSWFPRLFTPSWSAISEPQARQIAMGTSSAHSLNPNNLLDPGVGPSSSPSDRVRPSGSTAKGRTASYLGGSSNAQVNDKIIEKIPFERCSY